MGFLDTLGKIAKGVAESAERQSNELRALKMRLEEKSDDELKKMIKSEGGFFGVSQKEKAVAYKILRERGVVS